MSVACPKVEAVAKSTTISREIHGDGAEHCELRFRRVSQPRRPATTLPIVCNSCDRIPSLFGHELAISQLLLPQTTRRRTSDSRESPSNRKDASCRFRPLVCVWPDAEGRTTTHFRPQRHSTSSPRPWARILSSCRRIIPLLRLPLPCPTPLLQLLPEGLVRLSRPRLSR